MLPSAIDDLIRVVERTNVEEIKERPRKRAASIAASQALGVVSVPNLPRNAAPPSPERGLKRNKSDETHNRRSQPRLSRPAATVKDAVASLLDEVEQLRDAVSEGDAVRRESIELQSRNADLTIVQRSLRATKAAQSCQAAKVSAVFDTLNQTDFEETEAGRKKFSRSIKAQT